jgi:uncharacterized protein (DUF433 family)
MAELPTSEYVEIRNGGYYVARTRISLASIIHSFRQGESPETIFENFPLVGSPARVYGAIAFILDHPEAVEAYLRDQDRLWEEMRQKHPMPPELIERLRRAKEAMAREPA